MDNNAHYSSNVGGRTIITAGSAKSEENQSNCNNFNSSSISKKQYQRQSRQSHKKKSAYQHPKIVLEKICSFLGGFSGLVCRSIAQNINSLRMMTVKETLLMFELLDFMFHMRKRQKGLMTLIHHNFKTFLEPSSIDPNIQFPHPTRMKEAEV